MNATATAATGARKRLPWRSRFGSMPIDSMYQIISRYGPCATSLLLLLGIAETSSGYSDSDEPVDWTPDRKKLADVMRMSEAGVDKAFKEAQRDIEEVLGPEDSPLVIKRNYQTNSWYCELRPKLIANLSHLPPCEKRTLPHKAEREEKRRAKIQAIIADLKCPQCGEPITSVSCHHCGKESPVGQLYQRESGEVINFVPPDTDVTPPAPTEELVMAAGAGSAEPTPAKTPVLGVPVQATENTRNEPPANGDRPKTPVLPANPAHGFHAFVSALLAAFGGVFLQKTGKVLRPDYAQRIARTLGGQELLPALIEEIQAMDKEKFRGGKSGLVLKVAQDLRSGYAARKRLGDQAPQGGAQSKRDRIVERLYQEFQERQKKKGERRE